MADVLLIKTLVVSLASVSSIRSCAQGFQRPAVTYWLA
jgi:hypothetical protein